MTVRFNELKLIRGMLTMAIFLGVSVFPSQADQPGEQVYKTKCAACHGADGKCETPVGKTNKLRGLASPDVQKQSDADLTAIIANGKNKMPAYAKSLKAEQIKDLVSYVRSFAKKS